MKLLTLITTIILISFSVSAQNATNLDVKNGFNIFKLGSSYAETKKQAKLLRSKSDEGKYISRYTIKDIDNFRLFNYNLGRIDLIFYKDLLLEIQVFLPDYNSNTKENNQLKEKDIVDKIQKEYGDFLYRSLSPSDKIAGIADLTGIVGKNVTLIKAVYKNDTLYQTFFRGTYFAFISNEIYTLEKKEQGNQSGL